MGRAKLTMELIKREKCRNLAFQKRKISLKKKVHELSTLCGVKSIMIISGPKQTPVQDHDQPDIWPEDHSEVLEVINKYKGQPTDERKKKTSLLFNFFDDRNKKAQDALTKLRKSNMQAKYPSWDERFDNFSEEKLNKIASVLEKKLGNAKKFKVMNENKSNYYAYHLQEQQKMLTRKRNMEFEESRQPNKFHITSNSRQPIFNSYNSQFPTPMHLQIPMPVPLQQYRSSLDQSTIQRIDNLNNPCFGGSFNNIYATIPAKVEQNMAYSDPMAGMPNSINFLNNLMTAPHMPYFGESMQSMAQRYTDGSMQPMPQNYVENPVRNTAAASSQMLAFSPCQKDDQNGYY
ncbi:hypothetical protein POM88_053464 [Heracleum sosnowskyi]|uniref:MADS-box domain-containing protein n=1 Tax=Heracleum sosnowskyi TaxID=360622 RepID=A0AAD8LVM2_9APIA|nr:hypothetical protein POM88_053464 [Heracleum sosnowskyi]